MNFIDKKTHVFLKIILEYHSDYKQMVKAGNKNLTIYIQPTILQVKYLIFEYPEGLKRKAGSFFCEEFQLRP